MNILSVLMKVYLMQSSVISVLPLWILEHDSNSLCPQWKGGNSYHKRLKEFGLWKVLYKIFPSSSRVCPSPNISHICLMENFDAAFMYCRILRTLRSFLEVHLVTHKKCKFRIAAGFFCKFAEGLTHWIQLFLMAAWEIYKIEAVSMFSYQKGCFFLLWMAIQISSCLIYEHHVLSEKPLFSGTKKNICSVCNFMCYHVITRLLFGKTLLIFILIITVLT